MEIITYVREGAITHKDSLGNEGRTEAGDVAGDECRIGEIRHAEYKPRARGRPGSSRFWIVPTRARRPHPAWGLTGRFPKGDRSGRFVTLAQWL